MVVHMSTTDGESCVDIVNVQQQGDDQLYANNSQVIIPMSNTLCGGRLTGFMMSLSQEENGNDHLRLEVWRPTKISEVFEREEYVLAEHDIEEMENFHFANVSFAKNETIKFEKGSFIGIYQPPNPHYTVWSINTTGYSYYISGENISKENIDITRALNEYNMVMDSQLLIQIIIGK